MAEKGFKVAVVGASGAVGREMIAVLEEREFPVASLRLLASERSAGSKLEFKGDSIRVEQLKHDSFTGIELALFSAGGSVSKEFAPSAMKDPSDPTPRNRNPRKGEGTSASSFTTLMPCWPRACRNSVRNSPASSSIPCG